MRQTIDPDSTFSLLHFHDHHIRIAYDGVCPGCPFGAAAETELWWVDPVRPMYADGTLFQQPNQPPSSKVPLAGEEEEVYDDDDRPPCLVDVSPSPFASTARRTAPVRGPTTKFSIRHWSER